MDLLKQTIDLCRMYGIKPARSKGQNFLISESAYDRIIEAAGLSSGDTVLEVGPGLGFLTAKLAARAGRVIAVELDDKLAEALSAGLAAKGVRNVEVVNEDILSISNFQFPISNKIYNIEKKNDLILEDLALSPGRTNARAKNFKVVANIPYNITSALIRKFLTADNKPSLMVLMVQKEVGERIVARPPHMSLLAVSVQYYGAPSIVEHVPAQSFWPQPEVDSCILKVVLRDANMRINANDANDANRECAQTQFPQFCSASETSPFIKGGVMPRMGQNGGNCESDEVEQPEIASDYDKKFFQMVKFGFSSKRKMLKNNLSAGYRIAQPEAESFITQAGFNPKIRAQELCVDDWKKLFELIRQNML
jgi:16S rRNA (adenine1518-N6/adenine1519-N6)-dimethyltransferase